METTLNIYLYPLYGFTKIVVGMLWNIGIHVIVACDFPHQPGTADKLYSDRIYMYLKKMSLQQSLPLTMTLYF